MAKAEQHQAEKTQLTQLNELSTIQEEIKGLVQTKKEHKILSNNLQQTSHSLTTLKSSQKATFQLLDLLIPASAV